jgi:hypothetical protein
LVSMGGYNTNLRDPDPQRRSRSSCPAMNPAAGAAHPGRGPEGTQPDRLHPLVRADLRAPAIAHPLPAGQLRGNPLGVGGFSHVRVRDHARTPDRLPQRKQ